jgi:Outer membrane protein beta-barrel domain
MSNFSLLSILVLFFFSHASYAEKDWFVELGYGDTSIDGGSSAPFEVLTFVPFGGSSCIVPAPFNPCLGERTYTPAQADGDSMKKIALGRRLWQHWSVDLAYLDFDDFSGERFDDISAGALTSIANTSSIETKGLNLSATGTIPLFGSLSLFGRVGVFDYEIERLEITELIGGSFLPGITREQLDFTVDPDGGPSIISTTAKQEGTEFNYGLGLNYSISETFDIRLEYQKLPNIGDTDINQLVLGVITRF